MKKYRVCSYLIYDLSDKETVVQTDNSLSVITDKNMSIFLKRYEKYFYSNFSGDKLFEAYQFLGNARTKSNDWNHRNNYFEFIDILSASKQLNIPVNIEFLSSEKNIGKIVKTWSREAYPTIDNTEIFPSRYKISFFEKEDPFFINKNEYLPFP